MFERGDKASIQEKTLWEIRKYRVLADSENNLQLMIDRL